MKYFKRIIFLIFKPLNPIDVLDGFSVSKFSVLKRFELLFKGNKAQFFLIFKHLLLNLISIFFIPIAIILFFLKYKLIYINFWQIGAPPQQIGTLYKYLKLSKFDTRKIICLNPKLISNTHEANKFYQSKIIIIENFFLYLFFLPLLNIKQITLMPYISDSTHNDSKYDLINSLYEDINNKSEIFSIKKQDQKFLKKFNKNIKLKKFIVLNVRDNRSYSSIRNANINNYKKTINFLLKKKYQVIRLMDEKDLKIKINNKNYFEFSNSKINLYLQILLFKFAKFCIVTQSGPAGYASIIDTPFLLTNSTLLRSKLVPKRKDLIILKKTNLNFFKKNYLYNFKKIKFFDNTPNEILNATKEIEKNIKKKSLNKIFNSDQKVNEYKYPSKFSNALISKYFLRKLKYS